MDYVLDANVVMSMLISGKATYKLLLTSFRFYVPEYLLHELSEYESVMRIRSRLKGGDWDAFARQVFNELRVIPSFLISETNRQQAQRLTAGVDVDDSEYVALATELNLTLLTRDEPLHTGLQKKGFRKVQLFSEFLRRLQ